MYLESYILHKFYSLGFFALHVVLIKLKFDICACLCLNYKISFQGTNFLTTWPVCSQKILALAVLLLRHILLGMSCVILSVCSPSTRVQSPCSYNLKKK